ncbi:MAG: hypothetical protein QXV83_00260 [Candidatus Anstonellaceae archaeon]
MMQKEKIEKEQKNQEELVQNPTERQIYQFGLWLDDYGDIFSDFDPRPYIKRQVSDDFIVELKKRIRETPKGEFEVAFYLPKEKRNLKIEANIKKRIREYFDSELKQLENKIKHKDNRHLLYLVSGLVILFLSTYLNIEYQQDSLIVIGANLILPLGWFSIWVSLDYFLNQKKEEDEKISFFKKMKKCDFKFFDLEIIKEQIEETKQRPPPIQKPHDQPQ